MPRISTPESPSSCGSTLSSSFTTRRSSADTLIARFGSYWSLRPATSIFSTATIALSAETSVGIWVFCLTPRCCQPLPRCSTSAFTNWRPPTFQKLQFRARPSRSRAPPAAESWWIGSWKAGTLTCLRNFSFPAGGETSSWRWWARSLTPKLVPAARCAENWRFGYSDGLGVLKFC